MIESKIGQQICGLLGLIISGSMIAWMWKGDPLTGKVLLIVGLTFPIFAFMSLCLLLFPFDMPSFREKFGLDRPQAWEHYPTQWQTMIIVGVLVAIVNYACLLAR